MFYIKNFINIPNLFFGLISAWLTIIIKTDFTVIKIRTFLKITNSTNTTNRCTFDIWWPLHLSHLMILWTTEILFFFIIIHTSFWNHLNLLFKFFIWIFRSLWVWLIFLITNLILMRFLFFFICKYIWINVIINECRPFYFILN